MYKLSFKLFGSNNKPKKQTTPPCHRTQFSKENTKKGREGKELADQRFRCFRQTMPIATVIATNANNMTDAVSSGTYTVS
jgi:hypothetical protein